MAYSAPTAAELIERYPAFAAVSVDTITLWLAEAAEECASWPDDPRTRAEMAYAAARMAELVLGAGAVPAGVTSFRSGDFSATVSDAAAGRTGFDSTVYGREFLMLRRRWRGGPRLVECGRVR